MTAKTGVDSNAAYNSVVRKTLSKSNSVRVVSRIRPLAKYELANGSKEVVSAIPSLDSPDLAAGLGNEEPKPTPEVLQVSSPGIGENGQRWFEFDAVLGAASTQREVYFASGAQKSVCEDIFQGYNCTILAYGQTGAGKH